MSPQGTTVSLQQLFSTLPVRHKEFQRNIKKEYAKMLHILQSYCIISVGVRITCSNQNGQGKRTTVLCTSGSQSMRENIGAIFGPKQLQTLLPFQQASPIESVLEDYGLKDTELPTQLFAITGFVSRGDHGVGRSATDRQFFFINSRPCDPVKVTKLVNEVYHMYNRHQYPFVALSITVASDCVDVNVTPDKRQIFLQEEKLLLAILKTSLINMYEAGVNKISLNYTPKHITRDDVETVLQSPKSSVNLAGLKAAFSSQHSSSSFRKAGVSDAASSGPKQKTLQSFFKGSGKPPVSNTTVKSPLKPTRDLTKSSTVGKSVLEGFRYGRTSCSTDMSSGDSITPTPDNEDGLHVNSPESEAERPDVKNEDFEEMSEENHTIMESPKPKICDSTGDCTGYSTSSSATVDAPVCLQRKTLPLQFCLQELAGTLRRLKDQQRKAGEELKYRRFRAKINPGENQNAEDELKKEISKDMFKDMVIIGQFNLGFIITKLNSDIFMIDQHATDEKYNFEMLQQHTVLQGQKLIAPQKLHLTAVSENVLMENIEIFRKNGFEFLIDEDAQVMERVKLVSLPTSKNWTFGPADIEELIFMLSDSPGIMCRPSRVRQMFASRACRKSVMIGTALNVSEMKKLVVHMGEIEQPWNCPHGRPTMRHLANLDVISQD
uniref:Mismatch repair endonuclease PMS2 n=1 Tax=Sphaeramia orbicularis TaxID=375764 RepID=A0A673AM33_9TELE